MREFFRRHIAHNFVLKVLSVGLAVGLWLAVVRDPVAEVAVEVPIQFQNMPRELEISSENIPQAQIRLRGPERIIGRMQPADVYAEIDLRGVKPGERTFELTSEHIHKPSEVQIEQVIPSEVHIAFDTAGSREVEVHPRVMGTFAAGYEIGRIAVNPAKVMVSGPRRRVEAVEAAITDPIDVSGAINTMTFVRHAYVTDPMVQVVDADPVRITVMMEKAASGSRH